MTRVHQAGKGEGLLDRRHHGLVGLVSFEKLCVVYLELRTVKCWKMKAEKWAEARSRSPGIC